MKRILILLCTVLLAACTPTATQVVDTAATAAAALNRPHLRLAELTVTVHNPTDTTLTGDTSRNMRAVITVAGERFRPTPGGSCTRADTPTLRWNCPIRPLSPRTTADLAFEPDGTGQARITVAFGSGYLGGAVPVPIPLLR